MWKRIHGHVREKEKPAQIGNPVLLETTYDEDQLRRNPHVTDLQRANYRYNAPPPPQLSFLQEPHYRASEHPIASPGYSSPPHDLSYYHGNPTATSSTPYEDISPPSSPEPDHQRSTDLSQPRRFRSMRDVSPIGEGPRNLEGPPRGGSNIPVLRRAPPPLQTSEIGSTHNQKFWGGKVAPNSKVKWDDYSGEPSSGGKAASISPGSYAQGMATTDRRPMGYQAPWSGPETRNVGFSERAGLTGSRPPPVEPWSRATGRSQIAPPLKDDPSKKPLQFPRKTLSPNLERTGQEPVNAHSDSLNRAPKAADTQFVAAETHDLGLIKPIVPLKVGRNSPPRSGFTSPTSPTNPGLGIHPFAYPSPTTPTQQHPLPSPVTGPREQPEANLHPTQRTATPPYNVPERTLLEQTLGKDSQVSESRFSWTTYNSTTTYQHSPPPSPPLLPSALATPVPKQRVVTEPISAAASILSRRRPVPPIDRTPSPQFIPLQKLLTNTSPPPSPATATIHTTMSSPSSPPSPSATSTFSTTTTTGPFKALPAPPPTLSASDHISLLESLLDDLRIRRNNVFRLLDDMNKAAPPNPLITDFKRARIVEARKRAFEDELSEIRREEHEVGLKLHRAWKKREREDPEAGGSALWVRRVTS